jgi:hypothetical protein
MHRTLRDGGTETASVLSSRPATQNLPESGIECAETNKARCVRVLSAFAALLLLVRGRRGRCM